MSATPESVEILDAVQKDGGSGGPVRDLVAPSKPLHKPNEMIAMRPAKGRMTLLTFRIYQTLLRHAQLEHRKRLLDDSSAKSEEGFTMRLTDLIADARFESNNFKLFKEHIREMQTTLVDWTKNTATGRSWQSCQLLGPVEIVERGAPYPTTVHWTYVGQVREQILAPQHYTKILNEIGDQFRSLAAAVLMDVGLRYMTSPTGLTMREDVLYWAAALNGRSDITKVDYRYFKRDTVLPALEEVETLQNDFSMELIEHREGRRVVELQFRIKRKVQQALDVTERRNIFDLELVERMHALGIKPQDAESIYAQHDEQLLRTTVKYVEERVRNPRLPKIGSAAAFLRDALRKGYAGLTTSEEGEDAPADQSQGLPDESKKAAKLPPIAKSRETLRDDWVRGLANQAMAAFDELSGGQRQALIEWFEQDEVPKMLAPIARAWQDEGPNSKSAKHVFFKWLATRSPNTEPTPDQLLEYTLANHTIPPGTFKMPTRPSASANA